MTTLINGRVVGLTTDTWRRYAFGLELTGDFDVPGLALIEADDARPSTSLVFVDRETLKASWNQPEAKRVLDQRDERGRPFMTSDFHASFGYKVVARSYGRFIVSPEGTSVLCMPFQGRAWRWQRMLIARVLPLAATLQGLETLHASAVAIDGHVFAFIGPSGMGKSSLAAQLTLRGATFFTDDVLAVEIDASDQLIAHPGLAVLSLRAKEREALREDQQETLGSVLSKGEKTHFVVAQPSDPGPLAGIYILDRGTKKRAMQIERLSTPDPLLLLANTFERSVRTPERLRRQLEVFGRISEQVPIFNLRIPASSTAAQTAAELETHARSITPASKSAA
jgi:hypothetical protein